MRENYSRKRTAILEKIRSTNIHPTAEWVYTELKSTYKDLSLGTVYRNIKKFCDDGQIKSVGVFNNQEHFDGNVKPHSHFVCERCGSVIDVSKTFLSAEQKLELENEYMFKISEDELLLHGICTNCDN